MNLFDILGPIMVGPSSSHTAGAVRIGQMTRKLLGSTPVRVEIGLHGSFADTGRGHGTDRAILAGILGMQPDDMRIPDSFEIARASGLDFTIYPTKLAEAHPNTAVLCAFDGNGKSISVQAASLGGGRIRLDKLDGAVINCPVDGPMLIVQNCDQPGLVAEVASALAATHINIATLRLHRTRRGGRAVMVAQLDQPLSEKTVDAIRKIDGVVNVTYLDTK